MKIQPSDLIGRSFLRSVTAEQINSKEPEGMKRFAVAEVRSIDTEARTVELSFSSEAPVERWFGEEILSHEPGAMITSRLDNSAALLVNHNWNDQVGVVERVWIENKRGKAVVRFGKSQRADDIFQDVVDGIRKHVSVAYTAYKIEIEERKGQSDKVTLTSWEPYEISIVSVPADPSIGVGRSAEKIKENSPQDQPAEPEQNEQRSETSDGGDIMKEKILRDANGNLVRAKVNEDGEIVQVLEVLEKAGDDVRNARSSAISEETDRVSGLLAMGRQHDQLDLAEQYIKEKRSIDDFRAALLDKMTEERAKPMEANGDSDVGLSGKEIANYRFLNVIRALANPNDRRAQEAAAFERECSAAAATKLEREAQGFVVPSEVLTRALNTSTSESAAGDSGGYSIANELQPQSFIEMLRNRAIIMNRGRVLGGLVGNLEIPGQSSGATGYWIGEDDDATESTLEMYQLGLTPKTVAGMSEVTRKLIQQSSLDVESMIRSDLATALALTIDLAGFYGTGLNDQPLGIANNPGLSVVDFGGASSGGGALLPTYAEVVQMETEIATNNADVQSMIYAMAASMRGHFKTTQKFTGTNGMPIWEAGNTVNGYAAEVTNQINAGDLFFGNFADLVIGMWGGLDLTVDPYTHSSKGRLRIVAFQDVDFILRRIESFVLGRDAT